MGLPSANRIDENLHLSMRRLWGVFVGMNRKVSEKGSLGKLFFYATVVSGVVAAYLMYRRGESLGSIARQTISNPLGSLASEVKNAL